MKRVETIIAAIDTPQLQQMYGTLTPAERSELKKSLEVEYQDAESQLTNINGEIATNLVFAETQKHRINTVAQNIGLYALGYSLQLVQDNDFFFGRENDSESVVTLSLSHKNQLDTIRLVSGDDDVVQPDATSLLSELTKRGIIA